LSPLVVGDGDALLNPYETGSEMLFTAFCGYQLPLRLCRIYVHKMVAFTVVKLVFRTVKIDKLIRVCKMQDWPPYFATTIKYNCKEFMKVTTVVDLINTFSLAK
jgi:hypothetical protein